MISVVIPALNAASGLPACLAALGAAALDGLVREVIVADGGSADATRDIAEAAGARVLSLEPNRGAQLAAGCQAAKGPWLLTLHADTRLQVGWEAAARRHIRERSHTAGWFRFALDDDRPIARVWEAGVAARSRFLALPYGDQGLLVAKTLYQDVGGYRPIPLMEDVDLIRRLGRRRLSPLNARALTSAGRYARDGYWSRSLRNWSLVARYLSGADPEGLARAYERTRS